MKLKQMKHPAGIEFDTILDSEGQELFFIFDKDLICNEDFEEVSPKHLQKVRALYIQLKLEKRKEKLRKLAPHNFEKLIPHLDWLENNNFLN